mgnify:CR=1 FL=1
MLALTVREGDYVTIGEDIVVQVLKTGDVFRIASFCAKRGPGALLPASFLWDMSF